MGIIAHRAVHRRTQEKRQDWSPAKSLVVACVASFVSFGTADALFLRLARSFEFWRQARTEFAFAVPTHNYMAVLLCIAFGAIAVQTKHWLIPLGVGYLVINLTYTVWSWSGPGELLHAVLPLIDYRHQTFDAALYCNIALIGGWIFMGKLRGARSNHSAQLK